MRDDPAVRIPCRRGIMVAVAPTIAGALEEASRAVDFIFMLTRDDQTVEDCLDVLDAIRDVGLRHLGFKDVGVEPRVLAALNARIQKAGAASYMEVVSTTPEACLRSARTAVEIGVDRLLGPASRLADGSTGRAR